MIRWSTLDLQRQDLSEIQGQTMLGCGDCVVWLARCPRVVADPGNDELVRDETRWSADATVAAICCNAM